MAPTVPMRKLGKDGPEVAAIGLGTMGFSIAYGVAPSDEERFTVLDRAYELGCTNWDTAALYGDSEEVIGKWFARTGKRKDIFLATKFGIWIGPEGIMGPETSAEFLKKSCDESLKKLQTDCIDLFYAHRVKHSVPIEETVRAMVELKNEGKIRYLGLSEVSSTTLRRAHAVHPIAAVQIEYSPIVLDIEGSAGTDLLATCRELGVAVFAYSPLGRGLLTGAITSRTDVEQPNDMRGGGGLPRFSAENLPANLELVRGFAAFADRKGCTPAQLALAWLLRQGHDIIPIPGTKKVKYLEDNWGALKVQLTDEEDKEIRGFVEKNQAVGGRYGEASLSICFGDTVEEN